MATVWLSLNDIGKMVKTAWSVATRKEEPPSVDEFRSMGEVVEYHLTGRRPGTTEPARGRQPHDAAKRSEGERGDGEGSGGARWGGRGWGRNGW